MKATIYSTPTCGYCKQAKDLLKSRNIAYTELSVDNVKVSKVDIENKIKQITGDEVSVRTVPQIFLQVSEGADETYIGGFDHLKKYLN